MKKIGFNNFKAFGSKMQYFSKKKITLIYGPNSIGKSSLLHSQLFLDSLQDTLDTKFINKSFAGDELDLGDFKNFIHKHNTDSDLTYEFVFDEKEDVIKFLFGNSDIYKLYKEDIFNHDITLTQIKEKLESDYKNSGIKFKSIVFDTKFDEFSSKLKKIDDLYFSGKISKNKYNKKIKKRTDEYYKQIKIDNFFSSVKSHFGIDITKEKISEEELIKFQEDINNLRKDLKTTDDYMAKIIQKFYYKDHNKILEVYYSYKYLINNIDQIRFIVSLNHKSKVNHKVYINNDLYIDENGQIDKSSDIFKAYSKLSTLATNGLYILHNEAYNVKILYRLMKDNKDQKSQYFSPIRPYPKREDMIEISTDIENLEKANKDIIFNLKEQKIIQFFKVIKLMYNQGILNNFLPEHKKKNRNGILNSTQLWKRLITNKDLQEKISIWLEDKTKLQSTYKIEVSKNIYSRIKTWSNGWKKLEYEKHKEDIFSKTFIFICDSIENFVIKYTKIRPIFINELKFIDTKTDTEVTPRDMGLGISQMLPILISTLESKERKIYLEQPELHLHPKIQMDLMDEFIRSAKENDNHFMIETHSEHMLLRVMKRMRYTAENKENRDKSLDLTPDDICLLYIDSNDEGVYINELRLSKRGKLLDYWPNGFFEEGFNERFD